MYHCAISCRGFEDRSVLEAVRSWDGDQPVRGGGLWDIYGERFSVCLDWTDLRGFGVSATQRPHCLEDHTMRILLDVGLCFKRTQSKFFWLQDDKEDWSSLGWILTWCSCWILMLTSVGRSFVRVWASCQFYITLALVFQAHIDVGCGDLWHLVLRTLMAAVLTVFAIAGLTCRIW